MGGVPVLLMMAALGITYGWQPDQDGGVEYIIQLHPDEVRELRSLGEVTSVIDPAVQGHVSRIVLRVGESELPRQMPTHLANKTSSGTVPATDRAEASDFTPIAIPQLGDAPPEVTPLTLNAARNSRPGAVMKPQTGASGLSLPPSLAVDPAAASQAAGFQTTANGAVPTTSGNPGYRIPPPGTRSLATQPVAAPPFTGPMPNTSSPTGAPMATPRAGGPSTDPTTNRDASWTQFPTPTAAAPTTVNAAVPTNAARSTTAAAPSNVPSSLIPNNPFTNQANTAAAPTSAYGASPVSNADTFGRTPAGLAAPTVNQPSAFGVPPQTSPTARQGSFADVPSTESIFNKNRAASTPYNAQATQFNAQATQPSTASGSNPTNSFGVPPGTTRYGQTSSMTASQLPGRFGINPSTAPNSTPATTRSGAAPGGYPASTSRPGAAPGGYPASTSRTARPDPSLSPAQVAAGAWSVDAYGQPVDRMGRPVAMTGNRQGSTRNSVAGGNTFSAPRSGGDSSYSRLGSPTSSNPVVQTSGQSSFGLGAQPSGPTTAGPPRLGQTREPTSPSSQSPLNAGQRPPRSRDGLASNGAPPNVTLSSNSGIDAVTQPKRVAAQPLFNGLLLISVVANIYLIFWLKNLRVQYHDLVAAKRMASSGNAATS